ncbi:MAG: TM2 domain-containing protein [Bacteroidia bacterium]
MKTSVQKIIFLGAFFGLLFCSGNLFGKIKSLPKNNFSSLEISTSKIIFSDTILHNDTIQHSKKRKWIAAVLAFPIPFGMLGLHRWYLGTTSGMPLLYIATFGGGFGTLPFIDFMVILIDNDLTRYTNNPKLFMWRNRKKKSL